MLAATVMAFLLVLAPGSSHAPSGPPAPSAQPNPSPTGFPHLAGIWSVRWTRLEGVGCRLAGGALGVALDDRTTLSMAGFGTAHPARTTAGESGLAYGGLRLDYRIWSEGRWSARAALIVGGGNHWLRREDGDDEEHRSVFVVEPEVAVGARLGPVVVEAGVTHRWTERGHGGPTPHDGDPSGPGLLLQLRVG